jgi:uroporphyrin-III C-methyltransferase
MSSTTKPFVYLVGAGPGNPDLLTLRAYDLIRNADVVVYDRLVSSQIMDEVPPGTARIFVGKKTNNHTLPQEDINSLLVSLAREGRKVVRLKGGDPFMFGRGSEEAEHLVANGVGFEVVPGITSAAACSAACDIPLTHRGLATGVRFVTGHCRDDVDLEMDWRGLANPDTTLVIYMGLANIGYFASHLIANNLPPDTPAAAISNGTTDRQQLVTTRLDRIADEVHNAELPSPVLFVVGRTVAMREVLSQHLSDTNPIEEQPLDERCEAEHA